MLRPVHLKDDNDKGIVLKIILNIKEYDFASCIL